MAYLRVLVGIETEGGSAEVQVAEQVATDIAKRLGVEVQTYSSDPDNSSALLEAAARETESLVVVAGADLSKPTDLIFGSVASELAHHSAADVLFVHHAPAQWQSVALTTDGSSTSKTAVERGLALAELLGAESTLITVAKDQNEGARLMLGAATTIEIDFPGRPFKREVLESIKVASALRQAAAHYDLTVLGNRGMSGVGRLLGSVASKVTHRAEANLLLVNSVRNR